MTEKLTIGTRVKVKSTVESGYRENRKVWERTNKSCTGWYVGYTFKREGLYHPGEGDGWDYELPYLEVTHSVKVLRIKPVRNDCKLAVICWRKGSK